MLAFEYQNLVQVDAIKFLVVVYETDGLRQ